MLVPLRGFDSFTIHQALLADSANPKLNGPNIGHTRECDLSPKTFPIDLDFADYQEKIVANL